MNLRKHIYRAVWKYGVHVETLYWAQRATFVCVPLRCHVGYCYCHRDYTPWPTIDGYKASLFIAKLPNSGVPIEVFIRSVS